MHLYDIKNSKLATLAGLALLAACASTAKADGIAPGFYMGADSGLNLMTGMRGNNGGHGGGSNLRMDPGMRTDLEAGYGIKLADQLTLGVEAESGVIWNQFSAYESGNETELGGNFYQVPVLGNLILNYHYGKWTSYIGFGGGVDYVSANIWSAANNPAILTGDDFGPAVQALAGVRYALTDNADVGLGYQYLAAFSEKIGGDIQDRLSQINNHTISLTFTYHF